MGAMAQPGLLSVAALAAVLSRCVPLSVRARADELDAPGEVDGLIGESLIEPAEQGHVDGGFGAVRPSRFDQNGEQLAVEHIHLVVTCSSTPSRTASRSVTAACSPRAVVTAS